MEVADIDEDDYFLTGISVWKWIVLVGIIPFAVMMFNFIKKKKWKSKRTEEERTKPTLWNKYGYIITGLHPSKLRRHFRQSWKKIKRRLWNFVIDAFYVSRYRAEWGKYRFWDYHNPQKKRDKCINIEERESLDEIQSSAELLGRSTVKMYQGLALEDEKIGSVAHDHSLCERIVINISGLKFETQLRSLCRFPNTLLGNPHSRRPFFNPETNEYFFDRHRPSFEAIMYYYQSGGVLRCPHGIHVDIFFDELEFFKIDEDAVEKLKETEGLAADDDKPMPGRLLYSKLWLLMEYPESSIQAKIVAMLSIFVIVVSIFAFALETTSDFAYGDHPDREGDDSRPEEFEDDAEGYDIYDPLFFLETVCICWFTFEFLMRGLACPKLLAFTTDMMNIIDLIAILPYFVGMVTYKITQEQERQREEERLIDERAGGSTGKGAGSLAIFRVIRLVRVFRIFKLSRHSKEVKGLKVLGKTLKASLRELGMLVFFLLICIILFSSALYFAESSVADTKFVSIPDTFWYAVITMTTVGFGDVTPTGLAGKIVGGLCAVTGVLTISLPVPVIVSNFNSFYQHESYVGQLEQGNDSDDTLSWRINFLGQCPDRSGPSFILTKTKKMKKKAARRHYKFQNDYLKTQRTLLSESESEAEFEALKNKKRKTPGGGSVSAATFRFRKRIQKSN